MPVDKERMIPHIQGLRAIFIHNGISIDEQDKLALEYLEKHFIFEDDLDTPTDTSGGQPIHDLPDPE